MEFLKLPFFAEIAKAENILLAGAGGGFDIFCGLPLYFGLREAGKTVHLANLSFAELYGTKKRRLAPAVMEVTADTDGKKDYFPEMYLSQWFRQRGEEVPIYCFESVGVQPLLKAYQAVVAHLGVDAVILVDGGTDSLMRGDEVGLGTPEEDVASMTAIHQLDVPTKLLVCLGFGVDTFHGVCHAQFLEAVAALTQAGGFLGAWSLTPEMPEVQRYREATEAVFAEMPHHPSIVSSSILSAIEGQFGDYHSTQRTLRNQLFINPLMTLYWCFRLEAVANRLLYREAILNTRTLYDLTVAIQRFRASCDTLKDWENIPL